MRDARPSARTLPPSVRRCASSASATSASTSITGSPELTVPDRGLEQALAALRSGDTLVVPKLDRLARSVPDARAIGDSLTRRGVRLSLGGTVYDPSDPMGKCFFNILATFAEFEVDLLRMRTREGMAIARANGKLKGKAPKLTRRQHAHLIKLHEAGEHSISEIAELFSVSRATVYREIAREPVRTMFPGR
jgi:DNA invertase Pin-like site-specific DNA recombinase